MKEFGFGQECSNLEQVRNVLERDSSHRYTIAGVGVEPEVKPMWLTLGQFNGDEALRNAVEELRQESANGVVIVMV